MKHCKEPGEFRPTEQQIQYLMELEKTGARRGYIATIARHCSVNHGTVSRYFKACREKGFLTEKDSITPLGRRWLNGYSKLMEDLTIYLRQIGVPEGEIRRQRRQMIENLDHHLLAGMVRKNQETRTDVSRDKGENGSKDFAKELLIYGTYPVGFAVYKMGEEKGFSMANEGFEKPAILRHNKRGSWLVLRTCPLKGRSRIHGELMAGYLDAVKYQQRGVLRQGDLRNRELRIPLEAFSFNKRQGGELSGSILLTVSCSVGRMHMPESTAILVFWA